MLDNKKYMQECLDLARSQTNPEVPVAALIVDISTGKILARAKNTRETEQSVLAHAEINAIKKLAALNNSWNLSGYALYVNLEPCPMCAGAILQSHISQVIFGAYDLKTGAFGSRYNLINKNLKVTGGVLEENCIELLNSFFKNKR